MLAQHAPTDAGILLVMDRGRRGGGAVGSGSAQLVPVETCSDCVFVGLDELLLV